MKVQERDLAVSAESTTKAGRRSCPHPPTWCGEVQHQPAGRRSTPLGQTPYRPDAGATLFRNRLVWCNDSQLAGGPRLGCCSKGGRPPLGVVARIPEKSCHHSQACVRMPAYQDAARRVSRSPVQHASSYYSDYPLAHGLGEPRLPLYRRYPIGAPPGRASSE